MARMSPHVAYDSSLFDLSKSRVIDFFLDFFRNLIMIILNKEDKRAIYIQVIIQVIKESIHERYRN
jgi:hypothetical protein